MRKVLFTLMAVVVAVSAFVFSSRAENVSLRGDYVEVRTASVFAGACHFNGEVTTAGREAMMAWNVTSGKWQGVDLTGVKVMAIVSSDANLERQEMPHVSRKSLSIVHRVSNHSAMLNAIKEKYAASLGNIVKVRNATISFRSRRQRPTQSQLTTQRSTSKQCPTISAARCQTWFGTHRS